MGDRKPNIKSLVRRQDVVGLVEAASYQDIAPNSAGTVSDLGAPVRADAIIALGSLAPGRGITAITAGLRDPADRVRCAAVRVLHALQEPGELSEALRWLPTDVGHSRELALQAIMDLRERVRPSAVAAALVHREDDDLLGEQDGQLVAALLDEAGGDAADEVFEFLVGALDDERGIVVDRAAEMLVRLAPESIDALVAELHTGSNPADAAYVLGRIGDHETLDVLVKALQHRDASVRAESAAALGELQDPGAVKPLLRATRDREHSVRSQARVALDRMGTIAVIEGVAELLRPVVRESVRSAIRHQESEADAGTPPPSSPPHRQYRAPRSNGGPPEAADPPPTRHRRRQ
jgi:HEAT repeat protein